MERILKARDVARALNTAEDALDAAIRDYARLTATLIDARTGMGLSATVGADIAVRMALVQTGLAGARAETAAMHDALSAVKDGIGLRSVAVGVGDKTNPPPQALTEPQAVTRLRAG